MGTKINYYRFICFIFYMYITGEKIEVSKIIYLFIKKFNTF